MDLTIRINRIVGQLKGVQRMIDEKRDCNDVLQQISAIKKAIDGLSRELVMHDVSRFITQDTDKKRLASVMERIVNL